MSKPPPARSSEELVIKVANAIKRAKRVIAKSKRAVAEARKLSAKLAAARGSRARDEER
jgi:hypothetical protein